MANRHERRRLQSTMPKLDYTEHLQNENTHLRLELSRLQSELNHCIMVHNQQAKIIQVAEKQGHLTISLNENMPDENEVYTPLSEAERQAEIAYISGFNDAPQVLAGMNSVLGDLREVTAVINNTAACANGPATRLAMQKAVGHLMDVLKNLEVEIKQLENLNHPLIEIYHNNIQQAINQLNELQKHATNYVVQQIDASQEVLRSYVKATGSAAIQNLYSELKDIAKRGAKTKKINAEIGRMAALKADPGRGKMYQIGLDVLDDLRHIEPHMRTEFQKQCIIKLEKLAHKDNWRELGTYIADVRKAKMSIQSVE